MHISICFDLLDYKKVKFSFTWKCENTTNENAKLNILRTAFNKDSDNEDYSPENATTEHLEKSKNGEGGL